MHSRLEALPLSSFLTLSNLLFTDSPVNARGCSRHGLRGTFGRRDPQITSTKSVAIGINSKPFSLKLFENCIVQRLPQMPILEPCVLHHSGMSGNPGLVLPHECEGRAFELRGRLVEVPPVGPERRFFQGNDGRARGARKAREPGPSFVAGRDVF